MQLSEGVLIAGLSVVLSFAVAWGTFLARLAALERRVIALERDLAVHLEAMREDLGKLSSQVAYLNGQLAARGLTPPPAREGS